MLKKIYEPISLLFLYFFIFEPFQCTTIDQIFTGCAGHTLSFDGQNKYVQIDAPYCAEKNPFEVYEMTYELWVYIADWKNDFQFIIGQGGENSIKLLRNLDSGEVYVHNKAGVAECFIINIACTPTLKQWYHMALGYNGTHFFLYCNGELPRSNVINCTGNGPAKWVKRMDIGQDSDQPGTKNSYGMFDEIRGWSKFLTLEEINSRRFRTLTKVEKADPNLTFYYSFDEGSGNILKDSSPNQLDGYLGGSDTNHRISKIPKWVKSECPIVSSYCVLETKFGKINYDIQFKIYILEKNGTIDLSNNFTGYKISLKIIKLPTNGSLHDAKTDSLITVTNQSLSTNEFTYVTPSLSNEKSSSDEIHYCIYLDSNELCNKYKISIIQNVEPFGGTAGFSFWFDGIDDYLYSERFLWPAKNYTRSFGGGPATVEWWQLLKDSDFIVDNYLASGASTFSIGNAEMYESHCPVMCKGRFQCHVPWNDGTAYCDYGWEPGVRGRIARAFYPYFNKWTHFALVSGGSDTDEHMIYLEGEIVTPPAEKTLNLPAGGKLASDLKGFTIGCWLLSKFCGRMFIDEWRVWNKTRTQKEIRETMNKRITDSKNVPDLYAYYSFNEIYDKNMIYDLSKNKYHLRMGGCSNNTEYYGKAGSGYLCIGDPENSSLPQSYPSHEWSDAPIDDMIYNISILENTVIIVQLNGTDANADEIKLIFLSSPEYYTIEYTYSNQTIKNGDVLTSPGYFFGTTMNSWSVRVTPAKNNAGWPLDNITYILTDGIANSTACVIHLNVDCLEGRFLNEEGKICLPCGPGSFNNITGQTDCRPCPLDYYQPENSQKTCLKCPVGYITLGLGAEYCVFTYKGCIFKQQLRYSLQGLIFNGIMIGITGLSIILIITYHNNKQKKEILESAISIQSKKAKANKKLSGADLLDIFSNLLMFFQMIYYTIILDPSRSLSGSSDFKALNTIKSVLCISNLDFNQDTFQAISLGGEAIKGLQITSYAIIFSFACFSVIMRVFHFVIKKKFPNESTVSKINEKLNNTLLPISEIFFIPICATFFKVYSCTEESDDFPAFNDDYCNLGCWGRNHIAILVLATLVFIPYCIIFLISLVEVENLRVKNKKLHLRRNPIYIQNKFFFQLMISVSAKLLSFEKKIQVFFVLGFCFFMMFNTQKFNPYLTIKKMNRLVQGIYILLFFTTLASLLCLFIEDLNVSVIFISIWFGLGFVILVNVFRSPGVLQEQNVPRGMTMSMKNSVMMKSDLKSNQSGEQIKTVTFTKNLVSQTNPELAEENVIASEVFTNPIKLKKENKTLGELNINIKNPT